VVRKGSLDWPVLASDAALIAPPRASAKRLVVYIACHKHDGYDEDDVRAIIATYVSTCTESGLDPLLVVSQLLLECDHLTSASAKPPRLDPIGVGIGSSESGHRASKNQDHLPLFASWTEVARVHAGILLAYALRKGAENPTQRALIEEAAKWRLVPASLRGSAPTVDRLAAAWGAESGYAHRIRDIADTIMQPQW
jgi:hypothetical protein